MVRVNEVESVRGRRVRIVLDNGDKYLLLRSAYQDRPLEVGEEVNPEEFAQWVLKRQYRSALDKAVAMLAARACSKGEIEQKLSRTGYSPETIEMVIYKLEKNNLLNDQEFADQWVQYRAGQKYGPRRISQELRRKGVSAEETENALEEISEEQQLENAVLLARKGLARAGAEDDFRKIRQKVLAALVRRGYDWDTARQAVDRAAKELQIEDEADSW